MRVKTMPRKFQVLCLKSFDDLSKDHCFYDSMNTAEKCSWIQVRKIAFFYFFNNIVKSIYGLTISRIIGITYRSYYTKNEVFHWGFLQWMWPNPQEIADLVTFTEEILNRKFHFLSSVVLKHIFKHLTGFT